jgi:DNA-directed RNA polymerase specialized sigma24 family protein
MMPIDMCIESYAAAVHVVDSMLSSGFYLRSRPGDDLVIEPGSTESRLVNELGDQGRVPANTNFGDAVRRAASRLPFDEAQALWLVDVCGSSYEHAADEARTTGSVIANRVAEGRRSIRCQVASESVSSTSG